MIEVTFNKEEDKAAAIALMGSGEYKLRATISLNEHKSASELKEAIKEFFIKRTKELIKERIKGFTAVVGCGSMGSYLTDYLVRTEAKKLLLIDFDVVEARNLEKQLFFRGDIGEFKAKALGERYGVAHAIAKAEDVMWLLSMADRVYITSDKGSAYQIASELLKRGVSRSRIVILQSDKGIATVGIASGDLIKEAIESGSGWNNSGYESGHALKDTLFAIVAAFGDNLKEKALTTIKTPRVVSGETMRNNINKAIDLLESIER